MDMDELKLWDLYHDSNTYLINILLLTMLPIFPISALTAATRLVPEGNFKDLVISRALL